MTASADDLAYFQDIEKRFIALRGAPLLLSPADFAVAKAWRAMGIPLQVVLGAIEDLFAQRRERGKTSRVRGGLAYCRPAVENAWRALHASEVPVATPEIDVAARLHKLAGSLPTDLFERDAWVAEIRALRGDPERVEARLLKLDQRMLGEAERRLGDDPTLEAHLTAMRARLASRLGEAELEAAADRLRAQWVRERLGLPVLSLFALEAE